MQSALHVAIIMDGNGRWATARRRPRAFGHHKGAEATRKVVEVAPRLGIGTLTLYAFSADNWQRPQPEVDELMRLFEKYLRSETATFVSNGIRLSIVGRRDRIAPALRQTMAAAEAATARGTAMHLRIAIDYSARDMIVAAATQAALAGSGVIDRAIFAQLLGEVSHGGFPAPDVDLLVRTGGEQRLSDFLLWECAYAELVFCPKMWPDFVAADLAAAINAFHARDRRFGRLPSAAAGAAG
jgi:undecaprenyl diphosphate synthase